MGSGEGHRSGSGAPTGLGEGHRSGLGAPIWVRKGEKYILLETKEEAYGSKLAPTFKEGFVELTDVCLLEDFPPACVKRFDYLAIPREYVKKILILKAEQDIREVAS